MFGVWREVFLQGIQNQGIDLKSIFEYASTVADFWARKYCQKIQSYDPWPIMKA